MGEPTPLAHRVRDKIREKHAKCDDACPLGKIWAEDVQEILDAADEEKET